MFGWWKRWQLQRLIDLLDRTPAAGGVEAEAADRLVARAAERDEQLTGRLTARLARWKDPAKFAGGFRVLAAWLGPAEAVAWFLREWGGVPKSRYVLDQAATPALVGAFPLVAAGHRAALLDRLLRRPDVDLAALLGDAPDEPCIDVLARHLATVDAAVVPTMKKRAAAVLERCVGTDRVAAFVLRAAKGSPPPDALDCLGLPAVIASLYQEPLPEGWQQLIAAALRAGGSGAVAALRDAPREPLTGGVTGLLANPGQPADAGQRAAAELLTAWYGPSGAVARYLDDQKAHPRHADALCYFGADVLLAALDAVGADSRRRPLLSAVLATRDPRAGSAAVRTAADPAADADLRRQAVDALGEIGGPAAVPVLAQLLNAGGPLVAPVVRALARLRSPEAVALLARHATDPAEDDGTRREAITALGEVGSPAAVAAVASLLDAPGPFAALAVRTLVGFGPPGLADLLTRYADDPARLVPLRCACLFGLALLGKPVGELEALSRVLPWHSLGRFVLPKPAALTNDPPDVAKARVLAAVATRIADGRGWGRSEESVRCPECRGSGVYVGEPTLPSTGQRNLHSTGYDRLREASRPRSTCLRCGGSGRGTETREDNPEVLAALQLLQDVGLPNPAPGGPLPPPPPPAPARRGVDLFGGGWSPPSDTTLDDAAVQRLYEQARWWVQNNRTGDPPLRDRVRDLLDRLARAR